VVLIAASWFVLGKTGDRTRVVAGAERPVCGS